MTIPPAASDVAGWFAPEHLPMLPQRLAEHLLSIAGAPDVLISLAGIAASAVTVLLVFS